MSQSKPIEDAWLAYRLVVIPADAGEQQLDGSQHAFFAGALTIYKILMDNVSEGPDCEPKDIQLMQTIHNELCGYFNILHQPGEPLHEPRKHRHRTNGVTH